MVWRKMKYCVCVWHTSKMKSKESKIKLECKKVKINFERRIMVLLYPVL